MTDKFLIVGLGNPGRDYEKTRHNVGFWVIDELARRYALTTSKKERKALTYDGVMQGKSVILAKPQTYMNLSGEAVRGLMDFYKIPRENIIVAHDDLDLPLGTLRLRQTGGAGGQNGVKNIIQHVGTQDFARVRFGIGRPPGKMQPKDYVLHPFTGDDAILAAQITDKAADAIEMWLRDGLELAMTHFNGDVLAKAAQPEPADEIALALLAHEHAPFDPRPLERLARLYKKVRDLDKAFEMHMQLVALYEKIGNIKPMLYEMENAASIRAEDFALREKLARLREQHDDIRGAILTWLKLADLQLARGNRHEAERALNEAIRLNPQHPKVLEFQAALNTQPQPLE
jgi:peptidyl-tRNA hydrolase, PTH1 family